MSRDELDALELRAELYPLLDEHYINGRLRAEMLDDPGRALALFRVAARPQIRRPAAFVISRWRSPRAGLPHERRDVRAGPDAPPSLAALELAWSLREPVRELVLPLLAAGIAKHGGFNRLRP